jgi:hypothetical protein
MAYEPQFDFSDFQSTNPTRPLPGHQLDVELWNISDDVTGLRSDLKKIQRSDGALNNGIVKFETLAPDVIPRLLVSQGGQTVTFATRADAVDAAAGDLGGAAAVQTIFAEGLFYVREAGATVLADMPGWAPAGAVSMRHAGAAQGADETAKIRPLLSWASARGREVVWDGDYIFDDWADPTPTPRVKWRAEKPVTLTSPKNAPNAGYDYMVLIAGDTIASKNVTATFGEGDTIITLDNTTGIAAGDMLILFSNRLIETDHRGQARHGVTVPVARVISGTQVQLDRPMPYSSIVGNVNGAITAIIDAYTIQVSGLSALTERHQGRYAVTFTSGAASGTSVYIADYDPATSRLTCHTENSVFPGTLAVGNTFTLVRKTDVTHTRPSYVDIQGQITFKRAPTFTATAGDAGYQGLVVQRGDRPVVKGVSTIGFSETGVRFVHCYAPEVRDTEHHFSNRAYNSFDGTGYGTACEQSSWGSFEGITGFSCRRTLDFGGTQGVSYYNETRDIRGYGGGTAYDGVQFWPNGATQNSVVGSHGAAYGTRYIDSLGVHVYGIVNRRGDNEFISGVYGCGAVDRMVNDFLGAGNMDIDGLHYQSWGYEWGVLPAARNQPSNPAHKLKQFVAVTPGTLQRTKPRIIRNVSGVGVTYSVVSFINAGDFRAPLIISGLNVIADNEAGDESRFSVVRRGGAGANKLQSVYLDGTVLNDPAFPKTDFSWIDQGNFTTWDSGSIIRLPDGTRMIYIADDAVVALPLIAGGTCRLSLHPYNANRAFRILDAVIWAGQAGDKAPVTNALAVDVQATALAGTTGADGKVSISRVSNTLYIENRFGAATWFLLNCDTLV